MGIYGHIWTMYGHICSYMAIYGRNYSYTAIYVSICGHIWSYIWPYMAIYGPMYGHIWIYMTIYGHIHGHTLPHMTICGICIVTKVVGKATARHQSNRRDALSESFRNGPSPFRPSGGSRIAPTRVVGGDVLNYQISDQAPRYYKVLQF